MATVYEAHQALLPVVFPLSGPPLCVSLVSPVLRGTMRPVHNERTGTTLIELTSSILHPTSPAEKFYLEPSKQHEGLVHIRCCVSNKYWVAEQHEHEGRSAWFICGSADEPEEDPAKPSCTLFEFSYIEHQFTRLIHHQQKKNVILVIKDTSTHDFLLEVKDYGGLEHYIPSIISARRLWLQKKLPRYVAFKGTNGKYLTPKDPYLQFSSDDIKDPAVVHETFTDEYGIVRIRSIGSGRFWRVRPEGWICAESSNAGYIIDKGGFFTQGGTENVYADVDTLFRMVIKSDNYVALQSISSDKFCKRFTNEVVTSGLSALVYDSSTTDEVDLEIEEPVKSREIYDVRYRFAEAKKTSTKREPSRTVIVGTNRSDDVAESEITIEQYERTERWWDATLSFDVGIQASLKASVPILKGLVDIEGSFEGHANIAGEYKWGKSEEKQLKTKATITIPIGPMTKKICTIFASKEVLEVPFSYKKKDVLYSGEVVHSGLLHDGVYRGMEVNEFDYDITGEHLE